MAGKSPAPPLPPRPTSQVPLIFSNQSPSTSPSTSTNSDSDSDSSELSVRTGSTHYQQMQLQQQQQQQKKQQKIEKRRCGLSSRPLAEIHEHSEPTMSQRQRPMISSNSTGNDVPKQPSVPSTSAPCFQCMQGAPSNNVTSSLIAHQNQQTRVNPCDDVERARHRRYRGSDSLSDRFRQRTRSAYGTFVGCKLHHRCLWLCTVTATLISVFTFGYVMWTTYVEKHPPASEALPESQRVCLPCEEWSSTPFYPTQRFAMHNVYEGNAKMCCMPSAEVMKYWVKSMRASPQAQPSHYVHPDVHPTTRDEKDPPPFAHVLIESAESKPTSDRTYRLKLNAHGDGSHYNNVTVKDSAVQIGRTGLYYVYSAIYLKPGYRKPYTNIVSHYINIKRKDSPVRTLLKSTHTCNQSSEIASKFVAGVFCLEKNSEVFAKIDYNDILQAFEADKSYMGLLMTHEHDCSGY